LERQTTTKGKISKADIGKAFRQLEKHGYKVWNFGFKNRLTSGMKDWVDVIVAGGLKIYFLEIKVGKDELSDGQKSTAGILMTLETLLKPFRDIEPKRFFYRIVTESNYQDIIQKILEK
jgi:hypothetical protein